MTPELRKAIQLIHLSRVELTGAIRDELRKTEPPPAPKPKD